jgi:hypothetical protein
MWQFEKTEGIHHKKHKKTKNTKEDIFFVFLCFCGEYLSC